MADWADEAAKELDALETAATADALRAAVAAAEAAGRARGRREAREQAGRLRVMLADCARGMRAWASDEDGIHPDAWDAYAAAVRATPMQCPCASWGGAIDIARPGHHPDCPHIRALETTEADS